jgi:hypothetical protein
VGYPVLQHGNQAVGNWTDDATADELLKKCKKAAKLQGTTKALKLLELCEVEGVSF